MSLIIFLCLLLVVLMVILLGGCFIFGSSEKIVVMLYLLFVQVKVDLVWLQVSWQLVLVKFSVVCMVDSLCINVCLILFQFEIYKGVSWVQLVIDMIEDILLCGFEDFGCIRGVVCSIVGICVDYKLFIDVCCFELDYQGQVMLIVVIEVNVKLIYVVDQCVVVDCIFCQVQLVGSIDVLVVIVVFECGLQQLVQDVVGWMLQSGQVDQLIVVY